MMDAEGKQQICKQARIAFGAGVSILVFSALVAAVNITSALGGVDARWWWLAFPPVVVLGNLLILVVLPITVITLICGVMALRKIKQSQGQLRGKILAYAGMSSVVVTSVSLVGVLVWIVVKMMA